MAPRKDSQRLQRPDQPVFELRRVVQVFERHLEAVFAKVLVFLDCSCCRSETAVLRIIPLLWRLESKLGMAHVKDRYKRQDEHL